MTSTGYIPRNISTLGTSVLDAAQCMFTCHDRYTTGIGKGTNTHYEPAHNAAHTYYELGYGHYELYSGSTTL